jgi:hypothetical protein
MLSFMQVLAVSHNVIAAVFVQLCRIEMACPPVETASLRSKNDASIKAWLGEHRDMATAVS